ncbi:MAG TPA: M28 family peptidase [Candidatus Thermoplasmatota archaeon]|nr:M28 family peptidase [Candidatus Thermoplasmatota archaeon]
MAGLVLLAALLAGCGNPQHPPVPGLDGEAALRFVKEFATYPDGAPRFRMPGTVGQQEGAAVLWNATAVPGWERTWQNFTGEDYLRLDRTVVAGYTPGPGVHRAYCSEGDERRVPGLRFANLLAVHPGPRGAPMVLLAAHWDSQMNSNYDPDASKRHLPDPGANDGASGVGLLLQLMRQIPAGLPVSVGILFVDGEDGFYNCYPDAGSLYFAQHPAASASAFILLDMVGDPGALYPKETNSVRSAASLVELVWRHGQSTAYGAAHFVNRSADISDDHLAFIQAGIPAIDIVDAGRPTTFPPQWDTTMDTVDKLDAAMLGLVGDTLLATLRDPSLPGLLQAP